MIYFQDNIYLWLIVLVLPFLFLIKTQKSGIDKIFAKDVASKLISKNSGLNHKTRMIFLIISYIFIIISLSRPVINNGEIKVKSSFVNIIVGIDISKSMLANDIYPNRFEFAKKKFLDMLNHLSNTKVSLMGFSTQTFLISPLTQDFHSLKFLTNNFQVQNLTLKGTDIMNTLESADELFSKEKNKILLLLTDGGDNDDFDGEIEYAKAHNITVYIYNIGTQKGGVIKDENGEVLKDSSGNIVVTKLNSTIKRLALQSGGAYLEYSLSSDDIKLITDDIKNKFKAKKESIDTIKDTKELFVYPLMVAMILFVMGIFSMPRNKERK
jgi:Ca-activated chloride channel family protein